MQSNFDLKAIRSDIITELAERRSQNTQASSRENVNSRGDAMLDLVRETSALEIRRFNDMTDHDIEVEPGVIWEDLNTFNQEHCEGQLQIEKVENKCIKLTLPGAQGPEEDITNSELLVKVKFFKLPGTEDETQRTRVRFIRKRGDLQKWYTLFKDMKDALMDDILLAPKQEDLQ